MLIRGALPSAESAGSSNGKLFLSSDLRAVYQFAFQSCDG